MRRIHFAACGVLTALVVVGLGILVPERATAADSPRGRAAHFAAAQKKYLSHPDHPDFRFGNEDFTIAAWVWLDVATVSSLVSKYHSDTDQMSYQVYTDGSAFVMGVSPNGRAPLTVVSAGPATAGAWHFVVAWHDAANDTINIQVNNSTVGTTPHKTGVHSGATPLLLGARNGGACDFLTGRLDCVAIWRRVLSPEERADLYNTGAGHAFSSASTSLKEKLVAWWDLDEVQGTRADRLGKHPLTDHNSVGSANAKVGGDGRG